MLCRLHTLCLLCLLTQRTAPPTHLLLVLVLILLILILVLLILILLVLRRAWKSGRCA